jgi:transposase
MDSKGYKKKMRQKSASILSQVDEFLQHGLTIKSACRIFGINHNWYYRQKLKIQCQVSPKGKCYKQQPNQLTASEVNNIQEVISHKKNFGKTLTTLYYLAMNTGKLFCGKSTFINYAHALGYKKRKINKSLPKKGFKASRPFEWLHVDITNVTTMVSGRQKVAFVKDNFSGALLHVKSTSGKAGSTFIRDLFQETFDKYALFNTVNPINILSDGGPENKGVLLDWIEQINAPPQVQKVTASTDKFPYSNSMSEVTHSIYKSDFMKGRYSYNQDSHLNDLDRFMDYYNSERYLGRLYGLTVLEVLGGEIPDKHRFKEQIATAVKKRVEENRAFNGCPMVKSNDLACST